MKISKILSSRSNWKEKAKDRAKKMRRVKAQSKDKGTGLDEKKKFEALKDENELLRSELTYLKNKPETPVIEQKVLCVLVVIIGIVSFRSVPRILSLFQTLFFNKISIPHFSSVINWALRMGVAIFNQVGMICDPWVCIIDCSIDIGTRKALVALRVPLSSFIDRTSAMTLKDCECIGIEISHSWNGELVCSALGRFFAKAGFPAAILKDGGSDLKKGVRLLGERNPGIKIHEIDDIGHVTANILKAMFARTKSFLAFIKIITRGASRIRQTSLAWLLPPKIRSKGRFQGITLVANWAQKILEVMAGNSSSLQEAELSKAQYAFLGLKRLKPFIIDFCNTCLTAERFLKLMKVNGLNSETFTRAMKILDQLSSRSKLRKKLSVWLENQLNIYQSLGIKNLSLPVSSDIIESLFGKFKTIIQRNPQAELTRLVFVLPLLCGDHTPAELNQALLNCSHKDMSLQMEKVIPKTLRQQRIGALKNHPDLVPKSDSEKRAGLG